MASLILNSFGLIQDRIKKLDQYKNHSSYSGKFFNGEYYSNILKLNFFIEKEHLIAEYISTLLQTTIFALILYFTLSTLSFIYFFKKISSKVLHPTSMLLNFCKILSEKK